MSNQNTAKQNNEQILNDIQSLQDIEKKLFSSLDLNSNLSTQQQKDILQKIKDYYIFSMIIVLSYFLLYFLIRHSINYHLIP